MLHVIVEAFSVPSYGAESRYPILNLLEYQEVSVVRGIVQLAQVISVHLWWQAVNIYFKSLFISSNLESTIDYLSWLVASLSEMLGIGSPKVVSRESGQHTCRHANAMQITLVGTGR